MSMNSQGRPTSPEHMSASYIETVSGSRGLLQAEDLLFEIESIVGPNTYDFFYMPWTRCHRWL